MLLKLEGSCACVLEAETTTWKEYSMGLMLKTEYCSKGRMVGGRSTLQARGVGGVQECVGAGRDEVRGGMCGRGVEGLCDACWKVWNDG